MPESSPRAAVVLLAAGEGRRVGADTNKVLLPLGGLPVFAWSMRAVESLAYVDRVVVVVRDQDRLAITRTLDDFFPALEVTLVSGGSTRHDSEWNALRALADDIDAGSVDVVAIHDTARPLAGTDLFARIIETAEVHGGALPTQEQRFLVPRDTSTSALGTLVSVQTPQGFRAAPLLEAYRRADRDGFAATDTAGCVERYGGPEVRSVPSDAANLKITFPEDVRLAGHLLEKLGHQTSPD